MPYLKVMVADRIGGIRRLAYSRLYTGAEPDGYHAAAMPGDGSLLRARTSGGRVYYQRVVNPGSGSNFASWTDLEAAANAGVALCADGSRALLFFIDPGGTVLKVRESTDYGATLGAAVTVATASGAVGWLAADVKANGDALILYSVGASVFSVKRTSGVWGTSVAWTNSVASIAGLACYYQGDWNAVICGTNSAGEAFAWTAIFGDGFSQAANTWSSLREVTRASAGSNVTFRAPFLSQPDTYRLTFVEKYTGSAAYNRPYHSYSPATADFAANLWREPVPFDLVRLRAGDRLQRDRGVAEHTVGRLERIARWNCARRNSGRARGVDGRPTVRRSLPHCVAQRRRTLFHTAIADQDRRRGAGQPRIRDFERPAGFRRPGILGDRHRAAVGAG